MSNLYDGNEFFLLKHDDKELIIKEPVQFDQVENLFKEETEMYGYNVDFLTEEVQLIFEHYNGGDYIYNIYDTLGTDQTILFQFGTLNGTTRNIVYTGTINLNTIESDDVGVKCQIEKTNFSSLLRTRYDLPVTINDDKTIDGKTDGTNLTQITEYRNQLHTKELLKVAEASLFDIPEPGVNVVGTSINDAVAWNTSFIQPDTSEVTIDELQTFISQPVGIVKTITPVGSGSGYVLKATEDGLATIYFAYTGPTFFVDSPNTLTSGECYINVWDGASVKYADTRTIPGQINYPYDGYTWQVYLNKDDEVYLGFKIVHNSTNNASFGIDQFTGTLLTYSNVIRISQFTVYPYTYAKSYNLFDVINQIVESITGIQNAVIAPFFSSEFEAGYRLCLQNGYSIRDFDTENRPLQTSLEAAINAIQAIYNIGIGYRTVNGQDKLVIMPMMEFNKTGVIVTINETFDYKEYHIKEVVYNEVTVGYDKFPDEDANTIDEFNTEQKYSLPIKTYKNSLVRKSPYPASGFLIEEQRREQFKEKPNDSVPNDDTVFIVPYVDAVVYRDKEFFTTNSSSSISFDKPIGIYPGDTITIANAGAGINGTYGVTDILGEFGGIIKYELNPAPLSSGGIIDGDITIDYPTDDDIIYSERDENFVQIFNILSNSSAYGLRISPKHNLYNFAPLLNIGTWFNDDTDKIVNSLSKNNGTLTTQFLSIESNKLNVGDEVIQEKEDVELQDFNNRERPYLPKGVSFKCKLSYEEVALIKSALRGETGTSKDYGRFLVKDDKGVMWFMKLLEMKYKPKSGVADLKLAKISVYS